MQLETEIELIEMLSYEDIKHNFELKYLADNYGMEFVKIIFKEFAGTIFYIPSLKKMGYLLTRYLDKYRNIPDKMLCRKLGIGVSALNKIKKRQVC